MSIEMDGLLDQEELVIGDFVVWRKHGLAVFLNGFAGEF